MVWPMAASSFSEQLCEAKAALGSADRRFAPVVRRVGPCQLERGRHFRPFEALLTSITHQHLSGKVAQTLLGRLLDV
jgi:3-methyladenine DNA glycosylase/8-oxoguanine DNA glycosylase